MGRLAVFTWRASTLHLARGAFPSRETWGHPKMLSKSAPSVPSHFSKNALRISNGRGGNSNFRTQGHPHKELSHWRPMQAALVISFILVKVLCSSVFSNWNKNILWCKLWLDKYYFLKKWCLKKKWCLEIMWGILVKISPSYFPIRIQIMRVYNRQQEALLSKLMSWPMTQIICHLLHSLHVTTDWMWEVSILWEVHKD